MRRRVLFAIGIALSMAVASAGLGHALGLFTTQMVATQAAVAYTDSAESPVFSMDTTQPADVENWREYRH